MMGWIFRWNICLWWRWCLFWRSWKWMRWWRYGVSWNGKDVGRIFGIWFVGFFLMGKGCLNWMMVWCCCLMIVICWRKRCFGFIIFCCWMSRVVLLFGWRIWMVRWLSWSLILMWIMIRRMGMEWNDLVLYFDILEFFEVLYVLKWWMDIVFL